MRLNRLLVAVLAGRSEPLLGEDRAERLACCVVENREGAGRIAGQERRGGGKVGLGLLPAASLVRMVRAQRLRPAGRDPASAHRALHPAPGPERAHGLRRYGRCPGNGAEPLSADWICRDWGARGVRHSAGSDSSFSDPQPVQSMVARSPHGAARCTWDLAQPRSARAASRSSEVRSLSAVVARARGKRVSSVSCVQS